MCNSNDCREIPLDLRRRGNGETRLNARRLGFDDHNITRTCSHDHHLRIAAGPVSRSDPHRFTPKDTVCRAPEKMCDIFNELTCVIYIHSSTRYIV